MGILKLQVSLHKDRQSVVTVYIAYIRRRGWNIVGLCLIPFNFHLYWSATA